MFLLVIKFKMIGMLLNVLHSQVQKGLQKHITKSFPTVPLKLTMIIIHSKYFPDSDWLKALVSFTITSYWWPNLEEFCVYRGNDVKNAAVLQVKAPLTQKTWGRGSVVLIVNLNQRLLGASSWMNWSSVEKTFHFEIQVFETAWAL